MDKILNKNN